MSFSFFSGDYMWAVYALISAIATAGMYYVSEYYKQGGIGFIMIIRVLTALYMLPIIFFIPWPDSPLFYIYTAVSVMIVPFLDIIYFRISANFGAGVLTRVTPVLTVFLFMAWILVDRKLLQSYLNNPPVLLGIVISILGVSISVSLLRKCSVSMKALKMCLPVFVAAPLSAVCAKLAFDETEIGGVAFIALFLLSIGSIPVYMAAQVFSQKIKNEFTVNKQVVKAAFIASIFSAILIVFMNFSADLTPNPAYTRSLAVSSGLWILLFYKLIGHQEKTPVLQGGGVVLFAMLLVFLSGQV